MLTKLKDRVYQVGLSPALLTLNMIPNFSLKALEKSQTVVSDATLIFHPRMVLSNLEAKEIKEPTLVCLSILLLVQFKTHEWIRCMV